MIYLVTTCVGLGIQDAFIHLQSRHNPSHGGSGDYPGKIYSSVQNFPSLYVFWMRNGNFNSKMKCGCILQQDPNIMLSIRKIVRQNQKSQFCCLDHLGFQT